MLDRNEVLWFPMRVSYSSAPRLVRLKESLDQEKKVFGTYIAMQYKRVGDKMMYTPAISNLIFVRASFSCLSELKQLGIFSPLRYIMHPVMEQDGWIHTEALYVPDSLMNDFIRVTAESNEKVIYMNNIEYACKPGQRVQITQGAFAGVKGTIKRIQGNVCVVVPIENTIAAAITGLPREHLRYLGD